MMYDTIKSFHKQFEYEPEVENAVKLKKFKKFVVAGMGGSHLAADLLKVWKPNQDIVVWHNYGLPPLHEREFEERLIIASSYSGNTEEAIDVFNEAKRRRFAVAAVAAGGKLIALAQKYNVPYVEMPDTHIQPRMALGLSVKALLKLIGEKQGLQEVGELASTLRPSRHERVGRLLARKLKGDIPLIYSSQRNEPVAYNWKIKFNETGKVPAFYNTLPELNHNEMTGFDVKRSTASLSTRFHFIFLNDKEDDPRIVQRVNILKKFLEDRGFRVETSLLRGKTVWEKIFNSLITADWTAYYTATLYGVEPEHVPMVEEFKKLIMK